VSKVLFVDDHPIVVSACRLLLEDDGLTTVFDANDISAGYQAFLQHKPDVVVVDLKLHGQEMGGLALIERMRSHGVQPGILVFSMYCDPHIINAAIAAGATGYLLKDAPPEELAKAVEQVRSGHRYMDQQLALRVALLRLEAVRNPVISLTRREEQALNLLAEGKSYPLVADQLGISYKTVVKIAYRLRQKLSAKGLPDLTRKAVELTRPKS
jgi:DNA-binding NarL/FixJ family response regulator